MEYYEELTDKDLFDSALNTYMVLVTNTDPYDLLDYTDGYMPMFIDIMDPEGWTADDIMNAAYACIEVFEQHEHYEKCADLMELINKIKDEIQGLPTRDYIQGLFDNQE